MKTKILLSALLLAITGQQAYAEVPAANGVEIYGLLDAGVSSISNEGGQRNTKFDDGIYYPNLLGFKGSEDLGGGVHAIFNLVDQFSVGSGAVIQGAGMLFGRSAWAGLESAQYGKLTMGNQYDFMVDSLFFGHDDAAIYVGGFYNFRTGPFGKLALPGNPPFAGSFDWDRMAGGNPVNSSVKYLSPTIDGFNFGAMYGFGGVAGSFTDNSTDSLGANYESGGFGAAAAYTRVNYAVPGSSQTNVTNWGVGTHYNFASWTTSALITTVRNSANGGAIAEIEVGAGYRFNPAWSLGADYMYMKGNAFLNDNHANQITANLGYAFSKRTGVYLETVYQRTNSGANALINGVLDPDGSSSSPTQFIARVGVQTRF